MSPLWHCSAQLLCPCALFQPLMLCDDCLFASRFIRLSATWEQGAIYPPLFPRQLAQWLAGRKHSKYAFPNDSVNGWMSAPRYGLTSLQHMPCSCGSSLTVGALLTQDCFQAPCTWPGSSFKTPCICSCYFPLKIFFLNCVHLWTKLFMRQCFMGVQDMGRGPRACALGPATHDSVIGTSCLWQLL